MRSWIFPLITIVLTVLSGLSAHAWAPSKVKAACERWLFSANSELLYQSRNLGINPSGHFSATAQKFLSGAKSDDEFAHRQQLVRRLQHRWNPVFEAKLKQMNLLAGRETSPHGVGSFIVNRTRLIELNPGIETLLPEGYRLAFAPFYNLQHGLHGWAKTQSKLFGLPMDILDRKVSFETKQTLVHELVHVQLQENRDRMNHHRFGFIVSAVRRAHLRFRGRLPMAYETHFSPEEIFAYLVNTLNSYERTCSGLPVPPQEDPRKSLRRTEAFIYVYMDVALPAILGSFQDAQFTKTPEGFALYFNDEFKLTVLSDKPEITLRPEEVRATLLEEQDFLRNLLPLFQDFAGAADKCAKLEPLWKFLKTLGIEESRFRFAS